MAIEIVDLAINSMVDLSSSQHVSLPEAIHYKVVPPGYVCWFINHRNSIDIPTINHSY